MAARCPRGLNPVESLRTRRLNQVIYGAAEVSARIQNYPPCALNFTQRL